MDSQSLHCWILVFISFRPDLLILGGCWTVDVMELGLGDFISMVVRQYLCEKTGELAMSTNYQAEQETIYLALA